MTPAENRALIQNILDARSRRDHAPFATAMADDFVWRIIGSTAWSGEYVGRDDVRERLLKPLYAQLVAPPQITLKRVVADGDYVVVQCEGDATTHTGTRYNNTYCLVIRMEGSKMREMTEYLDTALVERALTPPPWR